MLADRTINNESQDVSSKPGALQPRAVSRPAVCGCGSRSVRCLDETRYFGVSVYRTV